MKHFEDDERLIRNWFWCVVFRIVQNHGEESYFRRFWEGRHNRSPVDLPPIACLKFQFASFLLNLVYHFARTLLLAAYRIENT